MVIGVLSERGASESRVALTPSAVRSLCAMGHLVVVESGAGIAAHFRNEEYLAAGARIVYTNEEVFGRADVLAKVSALAPEEIPMLRHGQAVLAFHHLATASRARVEALLATGATLIGYEILEDLDGDLPVLRAMSELAGQLSVHVAAHFLGTLHGGRGILLGGATGIPPAHVVILGGGSVGRAAARTARGNGAQVTVLDSSLAALRRVEESASGVVTEVAHCQAVERATAYADVLIGAILNRGERTPLVVTSEMVEGMKRGAVILDASIDQGGCVETIRPTTLRDPVFVHAGVTHYAVPNMTSAVARTASLALSHAALPRLAEIARTNVDAALATRPELGAGVYVHRGELVSTSVGTSIGVPTRPLATRLAGKSAERMFAGEGL
jgi:alanine dehydrogenase